MVIFQKQNNFIVRKWVTNFLTITLPLRAYLFTFNVFVTAIIYVQNGFSVGSYSLKCSYFSWNKSLKLWKENILTYLTFFDNSPEPLAKRRIMKLFNIRKVIVLVAVCFHEARMSRTFFGGLKASRSWKLKIMIILENIKSNYLSLPRALMWQSLGDFDFFILHTYPWYLQKVALNNYSSSPNRMGSESIAREAKGRMGYWLRGHSGSRNNCFSKIQLVGLKYRGKTTSAS